MSHVSPESGALRLAELVAALSLATDLGTGQPMEHALRACLLTVHLGDALGLAEADLCHAYYVALLRAIGCVADAHRTAARFGDELAANGHISLVDTAQPLDLLGLLLRHVGEGRPAFERAGMVAAALAAGSGERDEILTAHCEVALLLATRLEMPPEVGRAVAQVYERWDGKGSPNRLKAEGIARPARLVALARDAELFHRLGGIALATAVVRRRAGSLYDPEIAARFCEHAPALFAALDAPSAWEAALDAEPGPRPRLDAGQFETATRAIADFVDLKSPYTIGHSSGVALLAARAAERLGLPADEVAALRHAGHLHDLGRVGITAAIWDKPGPLTDSERERVRLHPYYTERVLARPPILARLGALAALHHERLDGSGYYRGIPAAMLPLPARVLAAADVYHAMTEPRPHRPAREPQAAAEELRREVRAGRLDGEAAGAVLDAAGHSARPARREWPSGLSDREVEVLRLIARGLPNREVARRLVIAEKTAGHHVQHIYAKIGVSTRAAATLFALQHDLLDNSGGSAE